MAKKLKGDQVFTGQLLLKGDVVFLAKDGTWSPDLQTAGVATNGEELAVLEALAESAVANNLVIDVYPFVVVRTEAGKIEPEHIREKLRTTGPSIAYI